MNAQRGFTIVETLVAVSVTSIIMIIILNFAMTNLRTSTLAQSKATIHSEIQLTMDALASDVRMSANADTNNRNPDANSPGGTNQYGWSSSATSLVLATAAVNNQNDIFFSDAANYITVKNNVVYFVAGGTLYKRVLAANVNGNRARTTCPANQVTAACPGDKILLTNITDFSVRYLDGSNLNVVPSNARSIEVTVTASKAQFKSSQSASYTTRMVFRND